MIIWVLKYIDKKQELGPLGMWDSALDSIVSVFFKKSINEYYKKKLETIKNNTLPPRFKKGDKVFLFLEHSEDIECSIDSTFFDYSNKIYFYSIFEVNNQRKHIRYPEMLFYFKEKDRFTQSEISFVELMVQLKPAKKTIAD